MMKFMSFQSWLAQTIADDGCCQSENISYLWADPNQEDVLDYFATQYDLNTVRMEDVQAAADEMYQKTQAAIASDFPDEIQVWRCGGLAGDVTSVTTNKGVATRGCAGGYYGGKDATVASYMVNRSDVLVSIEHLWPTGDFVEDELLVRPGSLRPLKESLVREYIRALLDEKSRLVAETSLRQVAAANSGGDCYEAAARYMMDKCTFGDVDDCRLILVHGEVMGQGAIQGIPYGHAWVLEGATVIDKSNGRDLHVPQMLYYAIGQIDNIGNVIEYSWEEARNKILESGTWGPWDLETESGL